MSCRFLKLTDHIKIVVVGIRGCHIKPDPVPFLHARLLRLEPLDHRVVTWYYEEHNYERPQVNTPDPVSHSNSWASAAVS